MLGSGRWVLFVLAGVAYWLMFYGSAGPRKRRLPKSRKSRVKLFFQSRSVDRLRSRLRGRPIGHRNIFA